MSKLKLPPTAHAYVQAINNHDAAAFLALFADDSIVHDIGRAFRGLKEIADWSRREIFDAEVTLDVLSVVSRDDEIVIIAKCDGTFDRTGLPDPLLLEHRMRVRGATIVALGCRRASNTTRP